MNVFLAGEGPVAATNGAVGPDDAASGMVIDAGTLLFVTRDEAEGGADEEDGEDDEEDKEPPDEGHVVTVNGS